MALILAALHLPLAASYPRPAELMALDQVAVAQVVAATLLFPTLLRSISSAVVVAVTGGAFLTLGSMMAGTSDALLAWRAGYMLALLAALSAWARALRTERSAMLGVTLAAAWTWGTFTLAYVAEEFGRGGASWWRMLGPLHGAVSSPGEWLALVGVMAAGGAYAGVRAVRFLSMMPQRMRRKARRRTT